MLRRTLGRVLSVLLGTCLWGQLALAQTYPNRPITLIVPWGAGGGTDAVARIIGALLEKDLGQPVNVVNRTGGNGVVGHSAISTAAADGYTLGMITVEISMMHWAGLTQMTPADFTPLSLMNIDPAAVTVRADSPYKTLDDLVKAIKAKFPETKEASPRDEVYYADLAKQIKYLNNIMKGRNTKVLQAALDKNLAEQDAARADLERLESRKRAYEQQEAVRAGATPGTAEAERILDWARDRMNEDTLLKIRMEKHPGLKDAWERFKIMDALTIEEEKAGMEQSAGVQASP